MYRSASVLVLVAVISLPLPGVAEEPTKLFPEVKCRYTLPGPDWQWFGKELEDSNFGATNGKGILLGLSTDPAGLIGAFSEMRIPEYDRNFFTQNGCTKHGGRMIAFRGVPTYQAEGVFPDGRTIVVRTFIAHGLAYNLTIIGNKEPVESHPEFDKIVNGFAFTLPPEPPPNPKRTFLEQKCQYTLPGLEWRWADLVKHPKSLLMAISPNEFIVNIDVKPVTPLVKMRSPTFIKVIEEKFRQRGATQLIGTTITFLGVEAYQVVGTLPDGQPIVSRVFIVHGNLYTLSVVGTTENTPDFEKIIEGFSLTEPPLDLNPEITQPIDPTPPLEPRIAQWLLTIFLICFVGFLLRLTIRMVLGAGKPREQD